MSANHIGSTIYVANAVPATNDAAGFGALTWTKVAKPVQGPQFGFSYSGIDIPDLETGLTVSVKGAASGTDTVMQFREVAGDAGQTLVKERADHSDGTCSIKMVKGSGTNGAPQAGDPAQYAHGYLHSYLPNQPTTTSYEGFQVNFRSNARMVKGTHS